MAIHNIKSLNINNTSTIDYRRRNDAQYEQNVYQKTVYNNARLSNNSGSITIGDVRKKSISTPEGGEITNPVVANGYVITSRAFIDESTLMAMNPNISYLEFQEPIIAPVQIYENSQWKLQNDVRYIKNIKDTSSQYLDWYSDTRDGHALVSNDGVNYDLKSWTVTATTRDEDSGYYLVHWSYRALVLSSYISSIKSLYWGGVVDTNKIAFSQVELDELANDIFAEYPKISNALKSLKYGAFKLNFNDVFAGHQTSTQAYGCWFDRGAKLYCDIDALDAFGMSTPYSNKPTEFRFSIWHDGTGGLSNSYGFYVPFISEDECIAAKSAIYRWDDNDINWLSY